MRAIVHETFGEPEEVLQVGERPIPEPGPGQVRLRVVLATIHNHDLWTIRGTYGFKPDLPAPAGTEVVGRIDAIGEGVDSLGIGQRVVSGSSFGTWADYAIVDAAGLIPVPDTLPDESAAQLVSMPFSAIALLDFLRVEPGQWIVQNAANGAVGRLLAQLAASRGVHVLSLVRRAGARDDLVAHGISNVVSTADADWRDQVGALTDGAPIVVGVDSAGGAATNEVVSLLAEAATLVVFGAMASPVMEISSGAVIFRSIRVVGFWGSKVSQEMDASKKSALFGELLAAVSSGVVTLPVAAVHDADDVRAAVSPDAQGTRDGKVLLRFADQ